MFQDKRHFEFGIVPGNGMHILWPEVIGSIHGRYFLLTRAHELPNGIAALPPLTARYTRIALTQRLRRLVEEGTGYGLALEEISAAEVARTISAQS